MRSNWNTNYVRLKKQKTFRFGCLFSTMENFKVLKGFASRPIWQKCCGNIVCHRNSKALECFGIKVWRSSWWSQPPIARYFASARALMAGLTKRRDQSCEQSRTFKIVVFGLKLMIASVVQGFSLPRNQSTCHLKQEELEGLSLGQHRPAARLLLMQLLDLVLELQLAGMERQAPQALQSQKWSSSLSCSPGRSKQSECYVR
jgi:hypothetical protein